MKNKIWFLVMMAGVIIAIMSCDDPKAQPVYCPDTDNNGNGHLGIGEDCIKDTGDCTGLQDYRTANMKNSSHADYFQWPIYRVKAESNYGTNGAELTTTVGNILTGYKGLNPLNELPNLKNSSLEQVHITYNAPSGPLDAVFGKYAWDGEYLKIQKNNTSDNITFCFQGIGTGNLPQQLAMLLQPASNIRMAKGKKSTQQFPLIAGGADKDPKVNTVAQNFRLNRQVIARNNRNVKTLLRHA